MASNGDLTDDDRLPWLETVDEEYEEGPSVLRIAALVILGLALIAGVVYAVYWVQNRPSGASGNGSLIRAQEGDYKVKPEQPGGMKIDGENSQALATSEGANPGGGAIDLSAVPEAPVTATAGTPSKTVPVARDGKALAVPKSGGTLQAKAPVTAPKAAAGGGGGSALVQLGSFPTEGQAKTAWTRVSKRFAYVASLGQSIEKASVNGNTVYRLRVNAGSADQAKSVCGKLKVAGEACFVPSE
ncbi:SPOR domain-containing protein [Hephaestia sp. GCM10023244]|uniref:SPOR domain-containing protein n=1 Tax=unclassified Hephaestia TaxID=2631281 RepID=UPI002076F2F1|nr:SPOR domain-containing protein [Hephaestia sp. MAHUQ-44]MCM8730701.1 SPOR domain-containing protein [Hephaestia sp. MAHUQ-44]